MAKTPQKQATNNKIRKHEAPNLDLDPDAWPKFEALVKNAAKMGPKPHAPTKGGTKRSRR